MLPDKGKRRRHLIQYFPEHPYFYCQRNRSRHSARFNPILYDAFKLLLVVSLCFGLTYLEDILSPYFGYSSLLFIIACAIVIHKKQAEISISLKSKFNEIWSLAEIFLFVLVSAGIQITFADPLLTVGSIVILPQPCCILLSCENRLKPERKRVCCPQLSSKSNCPGGYRRRVTRSRKTIASFRIRKRREHHQCRDNCPVCLCTRHSDYGSCSFDINEQPLSA